MLYDVLPPLTLFLSFGGIIVLVSRVVLRIRNQEFVQQIEADVASNAPVHEDSLLSPGTKGVQIVKNRIVHSVTSFRTNVAQSVTVARETIQSVREKRQEAKAQVQATLQGVQIPQVSFRERFAQVAQKGKDGVSALQAQVARRIPDAKNRVAAIRKNIQARSKQVSAPATVAPAIRLVRHTNSQNSTHSEKKGLMAKIGKREQVQTPLEKAANAIANQQFDTAEDILVPYIMKHASDAKAYVLLGNAAIGRHSWEEAMEIFQQVIKMDNSMCDAYAQLGHAALNAGRFTQAIEALQHVRNIDAKNITVREELLFIAQRMDNKVVERGVIEELEELKKETA